MRACSLRQRVLASISAASSLHSGATQKGQEANAPAGSAHKMRERKKGHAQAPILLEGHLKN